MNSSRTKLAAILDALGAPPSARRHAASPTAPACESLEGRQLLAGGLGFGGLGGLADLSGAAGTPADFGTFHARGDFGGSSLMVPGMAMQATSAGGQVNASSAGAVGSVASNSPNIPSTSQGGGFGGQFSQGGGYGGQFGRGGGFGGQFNPGGGYGGQGPMVPGSGTSAVDTQLQTDFQKLQADEQAIHDKSQVTPAMQAKVRQDVKAIKGAETTTPDSSAVATLQADLKAAQANAGGPTGAQLAQVQADQDAIYKSQGVNAALIGLLDADEAAIKTASGVTDADRATIAADRAAIQADLAKITPPTTPSTGTDNGTVTTPATPSTAPPPLAMSLTTASTPTAATPSTPATPPAAANVMASAASTPTTPPPTMTPHLTHAAHGHGGHFGRLSHRRG